MLRLRALIAVLLSYVMVVMPVMGSTPAVVGTITSAAGARVGAATASTGSTVFQGDHLSTDIAGTIQVRTGAARLRLSEKSSASLDTSEGTPTATLLSGTAVFSTANAKAFALHAATALIRPESDQPTVAQVTYVGPKELRVRSTRGSLTITVDGETQIVPEAAAYRVILDPDSYYASAPDQGPVGVGGGKNRGPRKAGRSRFLLIAIVVTGVVTGVALYKALESPDSPH
jgi:hypothetical protein